MGGVETGRRQRYHGFEFLQRQRSGGIPAIGDGILDSLAFSLRGKSETLLLRKTWKLEGILPVSLNRNRSKTVPVLPLAGFGNTSSRSRGACAELVSDAAASEARRRFANGRSTQKRAPSPLAGSLCRRISIASATTPVKLVLKGPVPGHHADNTCESFLDKPG